MKKLIFSLALALGSLVHAQSELYNTDWNLIKIVKNNITYMLPQNTEIGTPVMTFTFNPTSSNVYTNLTSSICGTSITAYIYNTDITTNQILFWDYMVGLNQTCTMPENIAFFTKYSDYFAYNSNLHHYQISYSGSTKVLVMTNNQGDQAFYNSSFLKNKDETVKASKANSIYPNPVKEGFVYFKNADRIEWVKVYSAEGKLILQEHYPDAKINVSNLLKGGYFMEVKSQSGISRHRFVKE